MSARAVPCARECTFCSFTRALAFASSRCNHHQVANYFGPCPRHQHARAHASHCACPRTQHVRPKGIAASAHAQGSCAHAFPKKLRTGVMTFLDGLMSFVCFSDHCHRLRVFV